MKSTKETDDLYKVPNLEKGIAVLELLSNNFSGLTLQEIKNQLDISQTTAYRILNTLVRLKYLLYNDTLKQYRLSRRMLEVGFRSIHDQNLIAEVIPYMRTLRDMLKETVCFGVMGEDKGIFITQEIGTYPFCFILTPGKSLNLHTSAPGKAIMAFLPETEQRKYLNKISYDVYNKNTISNETDYLIELEDVRQKGYALDNEEELLGVICIGAPIFNSNSNPIGAIWISGPKDRLDEKSRLSCSQNLLKITREISYNLGFNPDI